MEFLTVVIPCSRMLVFDVSYGSLYRIQFVEVIYCITEELEVTMKQHLGEHELLINRQVVLDSFYPLKVINNTLTASTCDM